MAKVWLNGEIVEPGQAMISVYDKGVLYGDGCFEGIRAYGGRIFKLRSHLERLWTSAEKIRLDPPYPMDEFERAIRETLAATGLADAYIRPVFTRGVGTLGLNPFVCKRANAFIIVDSISIYPREMYEQGMPVIIAKRPRIPMQCLDPAIKCCNYMNNILAKIEAIDAGVLEAIMLNTDGYVSECTGDNIFIISGGTIFTPPSEAGILHGVTRRFVMETVAPALGHAVEEKMFRVDEMLAADEVFLTGTAAEVIGVSRIDEHVIGEGKVGPITGALEAEFHKRAAGETPED